MTIANDCLSRRAFLGRYAGCLGGLALADLLYGADAPSSDPLAPKKPHHPAKARAVICLFQHGGPYQMDLFEPKPELTKRHGQAHPGELEAHFHTQVGKLLASPFQFKKHGKCGMELSELLPHQPAATRLLLLQQLLGRRASRLANEQIPLF